MNTLAAAPPAHLPPGTRLCGTFEIDRHIASGGRGDLYRGHHVETGAPVALKVMRRIQGDAALQRLRHETAALARLDHEAVARCHRLSRDETTGWHCLAMEFVDGVPLSDLVALGPLGFDDACLLKGRLAAGLDAVHRHGIIHRALTPGNVLVPGRNLAKAKIIGFRLARPAPSGDTVIGSGPGRYDCVSPEQLGLFGGEVTARSDIYSLGLVLAACLIGRPLDMGRTPFEVLEKRRALPELAAVDPRLRPLLAFMLQPDPSNRPQSMAAVAAWRPKPGGPAPLPAPPPRRRRRAAIVAALLAGAAGVAIYLTAAGGGAPDERAPILRFVEGYDGGDCFFLAPQIVDRSMASLDGLGLSLTPFEAFADDFERRHGFEAEVGVHEVTPAQCPAVNFLYRTRVRRGAAPRLDVVATAQTGASVLKGSVLGLGAGALLLTAEDGIVTNLERTSSGGAEAFEVRIGNKDRQRQPQLILAVGTPRHLASLTLPPGGMPAGQVFAMLLAEAARTRQTLRVAAAYRMVEK